MRILLTNDDSIKMPFLGFLIEFLEDLGRLEVLVPAQEQSWMAKSRCPDKRLKMASVSYCGRQIRTLSGSPADCTNVGIFHLFEDKPDIVFSGPNVGRNAGLSFVISSGTIGAAIEANIAGIPAVAISQDIDDELFSGYRKTKSLPDEVVQRLKEQSKVWLPRVFGWLVEQPDFYKKPLTWAVNLPFIATESTSIRNCSLAYSMYGSLYRRDGDFFLRDDFEMSHDPRPDCDDNLLKAGHVVVTAIDIRQLGCGTGVTDTPPL